MSFSVSYCRVIAIQWHLVSCLMLDVWIFATPIDKGSHTRYKVGGRRSHHPYRKSKKIIAKSLLHSSDLGAHFRWFCNVCNTRKKIRIRFLIIFGKSQQLITLVKKCQPQYSCSSENTGIAIRPRKL